MKRIKKAFKIATCAFALVLMGSDCPDCSECNGDQIGDLEATQACAQHCGTIT